MDTKHLFIQDVNETISLKRGIVLFISIVLVRIFLENLSSPHWSHTWTSDVPTLLHYTLWYVVLFLTLAIFLSKILRQSTKKLLPILLLGFPIIWLAPIVDLLFTHGSGWQMTYLLQEPTQLVKSFLTFFGSFKNSGVTPGIRVEVSIILIALCVIIHDETRSMRHALGAMFGCYSIIFLAGSLPSIIVFLFEHHVSVTAFQNMFMITNMAQTAFHPLMQWTTDTRQFEMLFNVMMINVLVPIFFLLTFFIVHEWNREATRIIIKNIRPERCAHYIMMLILGIIVPRTFHINHIFDLFSIVHAIIAILCGWLSAVCWNDIVDERADIHDHPDRPLPSRRMTPKDMRQWATGLFFFSLLFAYAVGHAVFFLMLIFHAIAVVYSTPPLRLKRFLGISHACIGLASLVIFMIGTSIAEPQAPLVAVPFRMLIGVISIVTLGAFAKDINDAQGDRADTIMTLPAYVPRYAHIITMVCCLFALILVPYIFDERILWFTAFPAMIGTILLFRHQPFRENLYFWGYIIFILCSLILVTFSI